MRWNAILLAACFLTVLIPTGAAKPDIIVDDGTCFGVNQGNTNPPIFADRFTGYCNAPCYCPGYPCQDWYAYDIYLFHACWV